MRGLAIEIDPGLPAVLVPGLLQELDLVCWRDVKATQGKDGRPHRDAPRALNHGCVTARAQRRGRHRLEIPRYPNPLQHVVQSITQCDDLCPGHLQPPVSPKSRDQFWKPGTLSVTGCHSMTPIARHNASLEPRGHRHNRKRCAVSPRRLRGLMHFSPC